MPHTSLVLQAETLRSGLGAFLVTGDVYRRCDHAWDSVGCIVPRLVAVHLSV